MKEYIDFRLGQTNNRWTGEVLDFDTDYLVTVGIKKHGNSKKKFLFAMNLLLFQTQTKRSFSNCVGQSLRFFDHLPKTS